MERRSNIAPHLKKTRYVIRQTEKCKNFSSSCRSRFAITSSLTSSQSRETYKLTDYLGLQSTNYNIYLLTYTYLLNYQV